MTPFRPATALLASLLAILAVLVPAATASAGELLSTTVSADRAQDRSCVRAPVDDGAATATRSLTVPGPGWVTARLGASGGDWDLALVERSTGRVVAGAASFGANEVAKSVVLDRAELVLQACRRSGDARTADVAVEFDALDTSKRVPDAQVVDVAVGSKAQMRKLQGLGLDLTEHGGPGFHGVVLYGERDAAKLRKAGFIYRVEIADLAALSRRERAAERAYARTARRSAFPSGRTTYRRLQDYTDEMKKLVADNPGLVKPITLAEKTYEGRPVEGIEITEDVNAVDGKPVFLQMGVHHAREWPSGEHAIEWAHELVKGYRAGDARTKSLVQRTRTVIVPVVNPDGFNTSREAGEANGAGGGRDSATTTEYENLLIPYEYVRKNCRLANDEPSGDCGQPGNGFAGPGVDPNRNYGGFWGGPGASDMPLELDYRGPGPFSEPETRNIQKLVSSRQVTTLISNHTFSNLLLRPPGIEAAGPTPDEILYRNVGQSMADENGYANQFSYELYDTTGTTEDWSYYSTGGLGYTFEIGPLSFHPQFESIVAEYDGETDAADEEGDGKGNREAYFKAQENTANPERHSVIQGTAPADATLRLTKTFKTATSPQPQEEGDDAPILFDDRLETVLDVPANGRYEWHVNPSTRPIFAAKGRASQGSPSPEFVKEGEPPPAAVCPTYFELGPESCPPGAWKEYPFEMKMGGGVDDSFATVRVTWGPDGPPAASDYDLEIYEDEDGDGTIEAGDDIVGNSGNGVTSGVFGVEESTIGPDTPGRYVARVINYAGAEEYNLNITFRGPLPIVPATRVESWRLTCERGGRVVAAQDVVVNRGERKTVDLAGACASAGNTTGTTGGATTGPGADGCVVANGFRSADVRGRGRRATFAFDRRVDRPVQVDVFQQSIGRRVIGERLISRYRNRTRSFTWNGRANRRGRRVRDGYYFVRYRMDLGNRLVDVRRVTLRRANGRFARRKAFYRRTDCGVLLSYKLTRPVFGGRGNRAVYASYRLANSGTVSLEVLKGSRVVRRFRAVSRRKNTTYRARVDAERLRRGDYTFRLTVRSGGRTVRAILTTRRL